MTDSRLQELERAWKASGSVDDEAAYLRERVRVGDLTQERLELVAGVGYRGAVAATGSPEWTLNTIPIRIHGLPSELQLRVLLSLSRASFRARLGHTSHGSSQPTDLAIQLAACEELCFDPGSHGAQVAIDDARQRLHLAAPSPKLEEYDSAFKATLLFALNPGALSMSVFSGLRFPSAPLPALINQHIRLSEGCWRLFLAWDLIPYCLGWFDSVQDRVAVRGAVDRERLPPTGVPSLACDPRHLLPEWNRCTVFDHRVPRTCDPLERQRRRRREVVTTLCSEAVLMFASEVTLPLAEWVTHLVGGVPSFHSACRSRSSLLQIAN